MLAKEHECIQVMKCQTPMQELTYVGACIKRLVQQGTRYKDIAVVARSLTLYENHISDVFERYQIPYFMDQRKEISFNSIIL